MPTMKPQLRPRGFTLIELLVVVTLLVVASGVMIMRMGGSLGRQELKESAARFAHLARTARELAVSRQQTCAIQIDIEHGGYSVAIQSGKARSGSSESESMRSVQLSWLKAERWPGRVRVASYRQPDGATASGGTQQLMFYPDGTSNGASLRLVSGSEDCQIVIHPHNARVRVGDEHSASLEEDRVDLGD